MNDPKLPEYGKLKDLLHAEDASETLRDQIDAALRERYKLGRERMEHETEQAKEELKAFHVSDGNEIHRLEADSVSVTDDWLCVQRGEETIAHFQKWAWWQRVK